MLFSQSAQRLFSKFKRELETDTFADVMRNGLAEILSGKCAFGHQDLIGHEYCLLATIPLKDDGREELTRRAIEHLHREEWDACYQMTATELNADLLQIFLCRCPDGNISWILTLSPLEYLLPREMIAFARVSRKGRRRLESLSGDLSLKWRSMTK